MEAYFPMGVHQAPNVKFRMHMLAQLITSHFTLNVASDLCEVGSHVATLTEGLWVPPMLYATYERNETCLLE